MTDSEHDDAGDPGVRPPGGPRPASSVHPVPPGGRLRQLADGSFVIEPGPDDTGTNDDRDSSVDNDDEIGSNEEDEDR